MLIRMGMWFRKIRMGRDSSWLLGGGRVSSLSSLVVQLPPLRAKKWLKSSKASKPTTLTK